MGRVQGLCMRSHFRELISSTTTSSRVRCLCVATPVVAVLLGWGIGSWYVEYVSTKKNLYAKNLHKYCITSHRDPPLRPYPAGGRVTFLWTTMRRRISVRQRCRMTVQNKQTSRVTPLQPSAAVTGTGTGTGNAGGFVYLRDNGVFAFGYQTCWRVCQRVPGRRPPDGSSAQQTTQTWGVTVPSFQRQSADHYQNRQQWLHRAA